MAPVSPRLLSAELRMRNACIIGLLSAIAIPNFIRFQVKAKSSEGTTNLAGIRSAEAVYFAELSIYVSADVSPNVAPGSTRQGFVASSGFEQLGWEPEGDVYFTYAVNSGLAGKVFHATAHANLDGDAAAQIWHYRTGDLESKTHVGEEPLTCGGSAGHTDVVEPCDSQSGVSVF